MSDDVCINIKSWYDYIPDLDPRKENIKNFCKESNEIFKKKAKKAQEMSDIAKSVKENYTQCNKKAAVKQLIELEKKKARFDEELIKSARAIIMKALNVDKENEELSKHIVTPYKVPEIQSTITTTLDFIRTDLERNITKSEEEIKKMLTVDTKNMSDIEKNRVYNDAMRSIENLKTVLKILTKFSKKYVSGNVAYVSKESKKSINKNITDIMNKYSEIRSQSAIDPVDLISYLAKEQYKKVSFCKDIEKTTLTSALKSIRKSSPKLYKQLIRMYKRGADFSIKGDNQIIFTDELRELTDLCKYYTTKSYDGLIDSMSSIVEKFSKC